MATRKPFKPNPDEPAMSAKRKRYNLTGIPTRVLWRELERRDSIAYARNVNRAIRGRAVRETEGRK
jgi:hypothetical protein